jgi:hypothetical protein
MPRPVTPKPKRLGKSVDEFCAAYGISRSTFETWRRARPPLGPAELQPIPGGRIIITEEAEAAWKERHTAIANTITAAAAAAATSTSAIAATITNATATAAE